MRTLPAGLLTTLLGSHRVYCYAQVWGPPRLGTYNQGVGYTPQPILYMRINDGSITMDATSTTRTTGSCTLSEWGTQDIQFQPTSPPIIPDTAKAPLTPFGNQIVFYWGAEGFPPQTFGPYCLTAVTTKVDAESGTTEIDVEFADLSAYIAQAKFPRQMVIPDGTTLPALVREMLGAVLPDIKTTLVADLGSPGSPGTPGTPTAYGDDPSGWPTSTGETFREGMDAWKTVSNIVDAFGFQLYFDQASIPHLCRVPIIAGAPVFAVSSASGTISALTKEFTRKNVYNHWIALCEGSVILTASGLKHPLKAKVPFSEDAADVNPGSPFAVNSAFGDVPMVYHDRLSATPPAAFLAAAQQLVRSLGKAEVLTVSHPPVPGVDAYDAWLVACHEARIVANPYIVDGWTFPLRFDTLMTTNLHRAYQFTPPTGPYSTKLVF